MSAEGPRAAADGGNEAGLEARLPNAVSEEPSVPASKPKVSWEDEVSPGQSGDAAASSSKAVVPTGKSKARWQWEHRTGFKDFKQEESDRIEAAYKNGAWMIRMKSGVGKQAKPREIYFVDMIQSDPDSNQCRNVRREPPMNRSQRFSRHVLAILTGFVNGEDQWWKAKSKKTFDDLRYGEVEEKLAEQVAAETYLVDTFAYKIVSSWWFNTFAMTMIFLNSVYIWIDADYNSGTAITNTHFMFLLTDNLFLIWFLIEAVVRVRAFKRWASAAKDPWFVLDLVLVALMILETWVLQLVVYLAVGGSEDASGQHLNKLSILRGARLLRLARIARLFKIFPQLFVLMKGMMYAMKSLFYTLLLLFVLTFVFAVVFKNLSDMNPGLVELQYDTVGGSFWNLLIYGTFMDDIGGMLNDLKEVSFFFSSALIVYVFISNLTMLNMLIGILCEVIAKVTNEEEDNVSKVNLERNIMDILDCYDMDNDQSLKKEEFRIFMDNPDLKIVLKQFSIDHQELLRLEDILFQQKHNADGSITFSELKFYTLLEKINQLRGGNSATVNDMVELRNWLKRRFNLLEGLNPDTTMRSRVASNDQDAQKAPPPETQHVARTEVSSTSVPRTSDSTGKPSSKFHEAVLAQIEQIRSTQMKMEADIELLKLKHMVA